jgi:putative ABC transport system permease protein
VVILAAVLLLGVGLLCLRLSLLTALRREVRELGVLKAIGVPPREVRNIQLAKYGAIGTAACLLGLAGGLALLPAMSQTFTMYAGTSGDASAWLTPVATAVAMLGLILGFVLVLLRRLDRISAVRALRGLTERSRWRGPRLTLNRSRRMPTEIRMGLIGALRRCQTHGLLAGVFAVASFVVIVPLSASMTLASPSFITYMGVPLSDLRIDVPAGESGGAVTSVLESSPDVDRYVAHTAVRTEISDVSGLPVSVFLLNGDHTTLPLVYADGRAPTASHEIALSLVALARTGHVVGDTIGLRTGDTAHEATIVGAYQDITNGGSTGRALLAEDGTSAVQYSFAVGLVDGTDPAQVAERLTAALPGARVVAVDSYRSQTLGPVIDRIDATARVAAAAAVALAVLVTVMIVRLILAADRGQIAIQRALGAPDAAIRTQYAAAVLSTLLVGVSLGILASATAGQSLFNVLFEGLYGGLELVGRGTSRIVFVADPRITLLAVPLTLGVTVAVATLAACRDISAMGIREVVTE